METERIISEILIFLLGVVGSTALKFFKDINAAHKKIRKIEKHLGIGEDQNE